MFYWNVIQIKQKLFADGKLNKSKCQMYKQEIIIDVNAFAVNWKRDFFITITNIHIKAYYVFFLNEYLKKPFITRFFNVFLQQKLSISILLS